MDYNLVQDEFIRTLLHKPRLSSGRRGLALHSAPGPSTSLTVSTPSFEESKRRVVDVNPLLAAGFFFSFVDWLHKEKPKYETADDPVSAALVFAWEARIKGNYGHAQDALHWLRGQLAEDAANTVRLEDAVGDLEMGKSETVEEEKRKEHIQKALTAYSGVQHYLQQMEPASEYEKAAASVAGVLILLKKAAALEALGEMEDAERLLRQAVKESKSLKYGTNSAVIREICMPRVHDRGRPEPEPEQTPKSVPPFVNTADMYHLVDRSYENGADELSVPRQVRNFCQERLAFFLLRQAKVGDAKRIGEALRLIGAWGNPQNGVPITTQEGTHTALMMSNLSAEIDGRGMEKQALGILHQAINQAQAVDIPGANANVVRSLPEIYCRASELSYRLGLDKEAVDLALTAYQIVFTRPEFSNVLDAGYRAEVERFKEEVVGAARGQTIQSSSFAYSPWDMRRAKSEEERSSKIANLLGRFGK